MNKVSCVVLGAGFSRRFGADKLLQTMASGTSVLEASLRLYQSVFAEVNLVLRPDNYAALELAETMGVNVVLNRNAQLGMSQSIVTAVNRVSAEAGWLFALADMPYIAKTTVESLCQAATDDNIVQPVCNSRVGNPVFISKKFESQLRQLKGDIGAKKLIRDAGGSVLLLECEDDGIHQDIDTPADLILES